MRPYSMTSMLILHLSSSLSHVFPGLRLPFIPHSTDSSIGINSSLTSFRTLSCTIYKWKLSHTFLTSCNDTLWKQCYNACVAHLQTFHTTSSFTQHSGSVTCSIVRQYWSHTFESLISYRWRKLEVQKQHKLMP